MTGSSQGFLRALALAAAFGLAACATGASTLDDTANGLSNGAGGAIGAGSGGAGSKTCGNGLLDMGEECDGQNLNGATCATLQHAGGVLGCDPNTCHYDMSMCQGTMTGVGGSSH